MVVFRSALDALDFAVALHEHTGDEQIAIRVGIHVGSPRIIGNDVFGKMVNYTKRVESAEENKGGIRLSGAAMAQIDDERALRHARLEFTKRQVPFKGYPSPETIWVVSDRFAAFKPPRGFVFGQP
jgi:class 3 adenylate cyclase